MLSWVRAETHSGQNRIPVYVNVYDMLQPSAITAIGYALGIGVFHSGVEVLGREYCFGGHEFEFTGVFVVSPRIGPPGVLFKESINMGFTDLTEDQVNVLIKDISREFIGNTYNLLTRNCNHFTSDFCRRLVGRSAPGWINRAAKIGTMFPCVVPTEWVEPPESSLTVPDPKLYHTHTHHHHCPRAVDGPIGHGAGASSSSSPTSSQTLLSASPSSPPSSPRSSRPVSLLSHHHSASMQSFAEVVASAAAGGSPPASLPSGATTPMSVGRVERSGSRGSVSVLRNAASSPALRGGTGSGGMFSRELGWEAVKEPEP